MPIAGVLAAPGVVVGLMLTLAVAAWYVGWSLRSSGDDWVNFVQDVRWGAHNFIEGALGWLRGWLWDVGSAILDGLHNAADRASDVAMRGGEVLRNWGETFSGWSDNIQNAARGLEAGFNWVRDWIAGSHRVQSTDMPLVAPDTPMSPATYTNIRVGQVEAYEDGRIADLRTYVDSRDGSLGATVEGVRLDGRAYTETRVGELGSTVEGVRLDARGYTDARIGELGATVEGVNVSVREYVDVRFGEARGYTDGQIAILRAETSNWAAGWQGLLEWLRSVWEAIAEFLRDPWAWLFARAGRVLWPHVEAWLSRVWDGDA